MCVGVVVSGVVVPQSIRMLAGNVSLVTDSNSGNLVLIQANAVSVKTTNPVILSSPVSVVTDHAGFASVARATGD